jgi:thioredoxin-dependent peroxiredoxin
MSAFRPTLVLVASVMVLAACGRALPTADETSSAAHQRSEATRLARSSRAAHQLAPGDSAPDFSLASNRGSPFHLSDELKAGWPLVLVFYPGRYCQSCLDLQKVIEANQAALESSVVQFVAVTRQWPNDSAAHALQSGSQLTILLDAGGAVADQYGVPRLLPGKPKYSLSPITIFIIDGRGQIACSGPAVVDGTRMLEHWMRCMLPARGPASP